MNERFGFEDAKKAAEFIQAQIPGSGLNVLLQGRSNTHGLILGSGLGDFAEKNFARQIEFSFRDIFQHLGIHDAELGTNVPGHSKKIVIGQLEDAEPNALTIAQSGREHPYEGVSLKRATFWIRVMQLLGTKSLIGSNASGILTPETLSPPSLMIVAGDQDLTGENPLTGLNEEEFGPRFPHMSDLYTEQLRLLMKTTAKDAKIDLKEGVYIRTGGPNYERPTDVYSMRGILDEIWRQSSYQKGKKDFVGERVGVVGMSSTYEAIVAKHASQSEKYRAFQEGIAFVSVGTNYAASLGPDGTVEPPTHTEVQVRAKEVQEKFGTLVREVLLWRQRKLQENCGQPRHS